MDNSFYGTGSRLGGQAEVFVGRAAGVDEMTCGRADPQRSGDYGLVSSE
jgi:hypothetical protein